MASCTSCSDDSVFEVPDYTEDDLAEALQRLQSREFIYQAGVLPVPVYRFTHALIRDVAYTSLPIAARKFDEAERFFWASATACRARVVFPEASGP